MSQAAISVTTGTKGLCFLELKHPLQSDIK